MSLNRPISTEAAAGKNPVSHVGKIYTLLTHHIAGQVAQGQKDTEQLDQAVKEAIEAGRKYMRAGSADLVGGTSTG
jgi:S-adenosylmethionine synthetase